jgi:hypothetical protein
MKEVSLQRFLAGGKLNSDFKDMYLGMKSFCLQLASFPSAKNRLVRPNFSPILEKISSCVAMVRNNCIIIRLFTISFDCFKLPLGSCIP